ncbi:MAG: ABC transporter permease subunit [Lachnoclostridium sp.]|nr:ABC transporter permease subunit [Lachnospira sp.]MCM1248142.1 ABC transporter permease subunit [Lachnoclostridium sp.]MCM1534428.1 ABC transporter permease subunit [Clostridium sp.]
MLCKACNTEIPKKATRCPNCGRAVVKEKKNVYPIAIAGAVLTFVGGFLPMIQSTDPMKKFTPAYGLMNCDQPVFWYLFMLLLVGSVLLCAFKLEKFSIITTVAAGVIYGITYNSVNTKYGGNGMTNGIATVVIIVGVIVGIAGCFLNINEKVAEKRIKSGELDFQYTGNKTVWQRMYSHLGFYLMFLPVVIFLLIFNYWPMLGLRYAFTDFPSGKNPVYVGIKQFVDMFGLSPLSTLSNKSFMAAFVNTLTLSILKLILNTFMAVVISILLNELTHVLFKKTVQTIIYLPHFMSWVVVASIFKMMLSASDSGMINSFLMNAGLVSKPIDFLTSEATWPIVYYIVNIWKDTGWGTILFLATLSGISPDLYEAAQIDGANRFNRMRYITLPALANTIITVFILNLAKVMNLFESVFVMYNPSVYNVSDVLQTYIYRQSFAGGIANYGYTTAVGLFRSLVSCALVLICNKASKKVRGRGIV